MERRRIAIIVLLVLFSSFSLFFGISCLKSQEKNMESLENRLYFPFLIESINEARSSVNVVIFEARYYKNYKDSKANAILDSLADAAKRGVNTRVIIEGGEPFLGSDFEEGSLEACRYLKERGVDARLDPKNITTHAKLVVIDKETVIIGSTNWNYYALEENNEASALIASEPLANEFSEYFEALWKDSGEC